MNWKFRFGDFVYPDVLSESLLRRDKLRESKDEAEDLIDLRSFALKVQSFRSFGRLLRHFQIKTLPQDDVRFSIIQGSMQQKRDVILSLLAMGTALSGK